MAFGDTYFIVETAKRPDAPNATPHYGSPRNARYPTREKTS